MGSADEPRDEIAPGDVLAKKYRVTDVLGQGGMGIVYAALHLRHGEPVAIKLPRPEVRNRKKALARFEREARAAASLTGPHAVRVVDVDALDDGTPFIVMELLVGKSLATELATRGRIPVGEAVGYVLQAAQGVAEAHAKGIVHRDLKPHNLFLVDEAEGRRVKVLDFGISMLAGDYVARFTTTNARLGTPLYVSPEQLVSARHADARSDVWSLGVILYELVTGTPPFVGSNALAVAGAIQSQEPRRPSELVAELPPELEAAMQKALAKHPVARFQSVAELALALGPFAVSGDLVAGAVARSREWQALGSSSARGIEPGGSTRADSPREESLASERSAAPRSPVLLGVLAFVGLGLLALALFYR